MAATMKRTRKKKPTEEAPKKKRAPRTEKYGRDEDGNLTGPFKAPDKVIQAAREKKAELGEPVPDDHWVPEDNRQSRLIKEYADRIRNPMTAIRAFCVECMGGYVIEVSRCESKRCPLYRFKDGNNPFHTRVKKREAEAA